MFYFLGEFLRCFSFLHCRQVGDFDPVRRYRYCIIHFIVLPRFEYPNSYMGKVHATVLSFHNSLFEFDWQTMKSKYSYIRICCLFLGLNEFYLLLTYFDFSLVLRPNLIIQTASNSHKSPSKGGEEVFLGILRFISMIFLIDVLLFKILGQLGLYFEDCSAGYGYNTDVKFCF